jgi:choloylglycine hydrolase
VKKTASLIAIVFISLLQYAFACTTFFINKNGQLIFGRNYDWISDAGMVCTNLKGLSKTSIKIEDGKTIHWISKYGSITFNQYGKELPNGGMNETGLVVELMWADGSRYPKPDDRPALGVLQWIQFQLDNFSSVEEIISSDSKIRISPNNPPLHYLIADADGNVATIEFLEGKMVVHQGKDLPFPALTNNSYTESVQLAKDSKYLSGNTSYNFQDNSIKRFTKACSMLQTIQQNDINKPVVDFAFDILDTVSQKEFTKWSIVYDLKNKIIYFKTVNYPEIKSLTFNSFAFQCPAISKALNMNQSLNGNVNQYFTPFNDHMNRLILDKAVAESKSQVPITEKDIEFNINYANTVKCTE